MGAKFSRRSTGYDALRAFDLADGGLERILREELYEAGQAGEAEAKKYVELAGTQKQWKGEFPDLRTGGRRSAPSRGREATGRMKRALSFKLNREGRASATVSVGWLNNYQDYFGYQDQGFSAGGYRERVQDPVSAVEGMKLMAHMRTYMRDQHDKAVDRAIERMMNAL